MWILAKVPTAFHTVATTPNPSSHRQSKTVDAMEIKALQFIIRLAEIGSVTRAARDLGIATSTLSRHVGALESEIGVLLFERQPGGMRVTSAGLSVVRLARRVVGDVDAIRCVAARSSRALAGELRLATQTLSIGPQLRAALTAWRAAHPGIALELLDIDGNETLAGLQSRRFDAAIIHSQATPELAQLELWSEPFILAVPETHPLAKQTKVAWADVRAETVLIRSAKGGDALSSLQVGLLGPGVDVRAHRAGLLDLLNLVVMGEGVGLTCSDNREITIPGVCYIDVNDVNAHIGIALAWWSELEDPVVGSFVAFMRDWVRARASTAIAALA